jgi:hypothetical protein
VPVWDWIGVCDVGICFASGCFQDFSSLAGCIVINRPPTPIDRPQTPAVVCRQMFSIFLPIILQTYLALKSRELRALLNDTYH